MLKDKWEFEYTASKLRDAAVKKKTMHEERLKFWEGSKAEVMAEVRESGIEISESIASNYGSTAMHAPEVSVRFDLQNKLQECHKKIETHRGLIRDFDGWVQVFSANVEARLKLHADDYLFFFGS